MSKCFPTPALSGSGANLLILSGHIRHLQQIKGVSQLGDDYNTAGQHP